MKILIICLAMLSYGCVDTTVYRAAIASQGAKAADAELESVEWLLCFGSSSGSVVRRYGQEPKWSAYKELCWTQPVGKALIPSKTETVN